MDQHDLISDHHSIMITCPCCMENITVSRVPAESREGNIEFDNIDLVINDIELKESEIEIWYKGICPKCKGHFGIADRFMVTGDHHWLGYDFDMGETNYDVEGRFII